MKGRAITNEVKADIQELLLYGMPAKRIAERMGLSTVTINRIKNGTHQKHLDTERKMREKAHKADAYKADLEALKKTLAEKEQAAEPCEAHVLPALSLTNVYGPESLLCRIADGIDYQNALLNGVLNKLEKLCAGLGL